MEHAGEDTGKFVTEFVQSRLTLYRAMQEDENGLPKVGESARCLGARPGVGFGTDIPVDPQGYVYPQTGGMSVAPNDPMNLHELRRPKTLPGGHGKDPVWSIEAGMLGDELVYRQDAEAHGCIEPARRMLFTEYNEALIGTQPDWALVIQS